MEQSDKLLKDFSDEEKGAYLGAIASIATADHSASEDEVEYIMQLADSAGISQQQKQAVANAATQLSGEELTRCLDILKTSDLRFSLITDLISFGQSDQNYSEEEKKNVEKIASYLKINQEQFSLLDQFVNKTTDVKAEPEEVSSPGFLTKLGLEEKFKKAGIDWKTVGKGLLGIIGPIMLAKMLSGRRGGRTNSLSRGAGLGSMLGGGQSAGGGLGSLISSLSGGRGFANSGGLLSRVLRGFKF
ncbi:MAG: tellurite resistance TerB family protein [Chitinophagaceae bacterium]